MSDKRIREIHGILATKVQAGPEPYGMPVQVTDCPGYIVLSLGGCTYPAGLSSAEARALAKMLNEAAARLEQNQSKS